MRINNLSNSTFTSRINFVPQIVFEELINPNEQKFIGFSNVKSVSPPCDAFYSVQLRSCTGGGVVEPYKKSVGFHLYDCKKNIEDVKESVKDITESMPNSTRGLLIGGKDLPRAKYSTKFFDNLKEELSKKIENLSYFKVHTHKDAETNYIYDAKSDDWYMSTQFTYYEKGKPHLVDVDSVDLLKKAFKEIKIAKGDELYILGYKVKREDAPEFFE